MSGACAVVAGAASEGNASSVNAWVCLACSRNITLLHARQCERLSELDTLASWTACFDSREPHCSTTLHAWHVSEVSVGPKVCRVFSFCLGRVSAWFAFTKHWARKFMLGLHLRSTGLGSSCCMLALCPSCCHCYPHVGSRYYSLTWTPASTPSLACAIYRAFPLALVCVWIFALAPPFSPWSLLTVALGVPI